MFQLNTDLLAQWAPRIAILLFCLPVHEFAHAWAANKLGDDTADQQGRLTLNPVVHWDLIGSALLLLQGFGWAKPVPVDARHFRQPRRDMALVSAAGPLANIIMATILLVAVKIIVYIIGYGQIFDIQGVTTLQALFVFGNLQTAVGPEGIALVIMRDMIFINLILACFNLLPIPPLDGFKFFGALLPEHIYFGMMRYERFAFPVLLVLMITGALSSVLWWMLPRAFAVLDFITMPINLLLGG
ncbi:MAG: site-2 protease family protein [Oscillospiraceae bacterium]|nr:site-2 protease family protein [Oscillospiraceae bacterium]